jgi:hypothetical protein
MLRLSVLAILRELSDDLVMRILGRDHKRGGPQDRSFVDIDAELVD